MSGIRGPRTMRSILSAAEQGAEAKGREIINASGELLRCTMMQNRGREKITDVTADRPQLRKLMAALAPGDVVIAPAVLRLSRDATDNRP
jgi:DNA invertase Pin-like site-specific DNA recombinase